jgi:HEAT repeat protein
MPLFGPPDIHQMESKGDIQGLIKALASKDAAIRKAAVEALAPLKDPQAVEPLVGLLKDEDAGVRRAAVNALGLRGGLRVVEPLIGALQDPDAGVAAAVTTAVYRRLMTDPDADARRATATALGRIRDSHAIEALIRAIQDADETVRVAVVKALQAIGDMAAIVPLINVLAREQAHQKSTGRSSLALERATSQALDALCDEEAVDALESALGHADPDIREIAARRLARIKSPAAADVLSNSLKDADPVVRRSAARGLAEMGWQPPANEIGARYWAALREWRRCAESGTAAIPLLVSSLDDADDLERGDIIAALTQLRWQPQKSDSSAAYFWAAQGQWNKCAEIGAPAIEVLDSVLRGAPKWRDRVAAAGALASMKQDRDEPFVNLDLVQRGLALLDSDSSDDDKRGLLEALLADEHQFDPGEETIEWCKCGYPAARIRGRGRGPSEPIADMLGFERTSNDAVTYYCPSCDTRLTTAAS